MMRIEEEILQLKNEENIGKLIIECYDILESKNFTDQLKEYKKFLNRIGDLRLSTIVDYTRISFGYNFSNIINLWIEYALENKNYIIGICKRTIEILDEFILDVIHDRDENVKIQCPLFFNEKYIVSAKDVPKSLFSNLEKHHIYEGRSISSNNTNSINDSLNNIEIISKNELNDFEIEIYKYKNVFTNNKNIKIAAAPFSKNKWFSISKKEDTFSIIYKKKTSKEVFNLLNNMEMNDINIALFPELSASNDVYNNIFDFLRNSNYKNLKIIVLGSNFNNRKNITNVFSGKGTLLISCEKQKAFKMHIKDKNIDLYENISPTKKIKMLDVENFGRIAFPICSDLLNDDIINIMYSRFHCNYLFTPVFSTKTNYMENKLISLSKTKFVTSVLCNSCAAIEKDNNYISIECKAKIDGKNIVCEEDCEIWDSNCEKKCESCYKVYTIENLHNK